MDGRPAGPRRSAALRTGRDRGTGGLDLRAAAALKVTAARLDEEVLSECMHIFGGSGYLVDETPLGRWWRDMKMARVGGGTDELLWELVAAAMKPDYDGHAELSLS